MKLGVITNPHSRKNRNRPHRLALLEELVGGSGIVRQTRSLEDLRPAMEDLASADVDYWVSDGGDGAFHWMVNVGLAVLDARPKRRAVPPCTVPTNGGTVNFVARKAGLLGTADDIVSALVGALESGAAIDSLTIDTLELQGRRPGDPEGELPVRRLGFGIAVGGVGQRFFSQYYNQRLQGPTGIAMLAAKSAVGYYSTLPGLARLPLAPAAWRRSGRSILRGTTARVVIDGQEFPYEEHHALHAGSFAIDVGAVKLFPYADQPGKLHFAVGTTSAREALPGLFDLVRGKPARGKHWHELAGERLEVWAQGDELLAPFIDGEPLTDLEYLRLQPGPAIAVPTGVS